MVLRKTIMDIFYIKLGNQLKQFHIYKKHYVTITHCTFSNLCHGILMDCAGDCTISKCTFENNELVVMHADRFVKGTNTAVMDFMNHKAEFSTSPIYLASKHNVPVSYVYALKESSTHYHFFASEGKYYKYPSKIKQRKEDLKIMLQDYTNSLETIINKYPLQWFNYYPFWENQK
jgi:predicted LPLAT superfamily acyltransferase